MADFLSDVTCKRCLQSAGRMIDNGLAEVGQVWRMHKDKTRTLVREELVLIGQNDQGDGSPSQDFNEAQK
jgi:hypothetical protein